MYGLIFRNSKMWSLIFVSELVPIKHASERSTVKPRNFALV